MNPLLCGLSPNSLHSRLLCFAVLFISLALPNAVIAQQLLPLSMPDAEKLALSDEPGQEALLAGANALDEQAVAAGQLPDPKLRVGLANFPLESGGFRTEGMTQAQLGLRQSFPPGRTRAVSTRQFQSLSMEMTEKADARHRDVLTAVRNAWLETFYWSRSADIVAEVRPLFGDLLEITQSLYSVGRKDQQDVLRAELELSRLDDRLIAIDQQRARAQAALSEWVGREAKRGVGNALPEWEALPSQDDLLARLATHPILEASEARIAARRAGIELAQERFKPGWSLDVGYGYRDGRLPNAAPRSDFVSVSATFDLPLFRKNRQNRSLSAALSERRAAEESKEQLRRRLVSQLNAEYARWQDLSRRIEHYEQSILLQSKEHAEAALLAYQSESSDFADVMRSAINELDTQVDYLRLRVDRAQSYSVLANLGGLSQ